EENARARVHRARVLLRAVLTSAWLAVAAVLGLARRLQRGVADTAQAGAAGAGDPLVTQLTSSVAMSTPAKAALISGVIGTVATAMVVVPGPSGPAHSTSTRRPVAAAAAAGHVAGSASSGTRATTESGTAPSSSS